MTSLYIVSLLWLILLVAYTRDLKILPKTSTVVLSLFLISVFIWGSLRIIAGFDLNDKSLLLMRASLALSVFIPLLFYAFALSIEYSRKEILKDSFLRFASVIGLLISFISLSDLGVRSIDQSSFSIKIIEFGPAYIFQVVFILLMFTLSLLKVRMLLQQSKGLTREVYYVLRNSVFIVVTIVFGISIIPEVILREETPDLTALGELPAIVVGITYGVFSLLKRMRTENMELINLNESKDEFISVASHQLRTPITMMKGSVGLLERQKSLTKTQKSDVENIRYGVDRMETLVKQLLDVSTIDSGAAELNKEVVNLTAIAEQEVAMAAKSAKEETITIELHSSEPRFVLGDAGRLREVLGCFIDNALHYSKAKGKIEIKIRKYGGSVELRVIDHGIGIPAKEQKALFSKFVRASNAKQARPDGTGLGLYIAKKIIEAHGGEIIFSSKEGQGSTFGFKLPVVKASKKQVS